MSLVSGVLAVLAFNASIALAETEEEEMARMQRELNARLFGMEKKSEPPPPAPKPEVVSKPAPVANTGAADTIYTSFKMDGVSLGMGGSAVVSYLKSIGYMCPEQRQMAGHDGWSKILHVRLCGKPKNDFFHRRQ